MKNSAQSRRFTAKSVFSVFMVLAIVATMFSFPMTASAADLGKNPKTKEQLAARTIAEIRQDMMDTYGFDDVDTFDVRTNGKAVKQVYIDLETTLSMVGRSPLRKAAEHVNGFDEDTEFFIGVTVNCTWSRSNGNDDGVIYVNQSATLDKRIMLHELSHVLDIGVLGSNPYGGRNSSKGSEILKKINGAYSGYTNSNQYVTNYAATNAGEDFADMFANMVLNGGAKPYSGSKETTLYKKYVAVYNLLLGEFGTGATCVKRSAAFLGIKLPKK